MAVPVDPLNAQPAEEELYRGGDEQQPPRQQVGAESTSSHWLGEIGVDIRSLATTIRHTASGVATFVHRSALTVAHEIARLEEEEEEEEEEGHEENLISSASPKSSESHDEKEASSSNNKKKDPVRLRLPWELLHQSHDNVDHSDESSVSPSSGGILAIQPPPAFFVEDGELKRRILLLSHDENSFLQPHRQVLEEEETVLDAARIDLIQRLLRADPYLSIAHKNLQSSISEATFWCNYFEACSAARHKYLQDQLEALDQNKNEECEEEDDDDEEGTEEEDSFVCIDASVKSFRSTGMRSVDSLVLVESSRFANSMKV
jgi:hypothetical protein